MKTCSFDPAFPQTEEVTNLIYQGVDVLFGLTKREYFAAQMMGNCLVSESGISAHDLPHIAEFAAKAADALIDALNKQP